MEASKPQEIVLQEKPGRLKFSNVINVLLVLGILISGLTIGTVAFNYLEEEKTADSWSILYLELERLSLKWTEKIQTSDNNTAYRFVIREDGSFTALSGGDLKDLTLKELGMNAKDFNTYSQFKASLWTIDGEAYRGEIYKKGKHKVVELYPIDTDNIFIEIDHVLNDFSHFYVINRSGQLVYTGSDDISQYNYLERDLVQNFVKQSLSTTFNRYVDSYSAIEKFGFFQEVPFTNLTLFIEIPVDSILGLIRELKIYFYTFLSAIILIVVLGVQIPLSKMNRVLSSLIRGSNDIANEDYNVKISRSSIFEFSKLALAFEEMARRLLQKDNRIKDLIVAEKEKVRLEGQVEIAGTVQELFLASNEVMKEIQTITSSDIAHVYVPAEDASGDWYQVGHFPNSNEVVYAIADVSGHGVGAAMFTAILDGLFERYRDESKSFPVEEFVKMSGRVMYRIGKTKWACTMQVIVHNDQTGTVTMFNAGHVPAQYYKLSSDVTPASGKKKPGQGWKSIQLASEPLGLSETPEVSSTQFTPENGDVLVLYTDGLTEAANPEDKMYGLKRFRKTASDFSRKPSKSMVDGLLKSCDKFRDGTPPGDDICIISIKFS